MDTDSLVYHLKTDDFYKDIASEVPARFHMSAHRSGRPLPTGLNKKVIGLMKDEMGGDIIEEFVALRPKLYYIGLGLKSIRSTKESRKMLLRRP